MIYSYSRLSTFETCPRKFYFIYILLREEEVTKPLAIGKAIHKVIEVYINYPSTPIEYALRNGFEEVDNHKDVTTEELMRLLSIGQYRIEKFRNKRIQEPHNLIVEHHFQINIGRFTDIQLQGYIDILDRNGRTVTIVDWKSGWGVFEDFHSSRQLALYTWVVSQITEGMFDTFYAEYHFLRFNKRVGKVVTKLEMEQARSWAVDTALEINERLEKLNALNAESEAVKTNYVKQAFPKKLTKLCNSCPFAMNCFGKKQPYKKAKESLC